MFSDSGHISTGKQIVVIHLMPSELCFTLVGKTSPWRHWHWKWFSTKSRPIVAWVWRKNLVTCLDFSWSGSTQMLWDVTSSVTCQCGTGFGDDSVGLSAPKGFLLLIKRNLGPPVLLRSWQRAAALHHDFKPSSLQSNGRDSCQFGAPQLSDVMDEAATLPHLAAVIEASVVVTPQGLCFPWGGFKK